VSANRSASGLGPETVLAQRGSLDVESVEVEDQVIVWNGAEGELHLLDPIATLVLRLCDGSTTLGETVADLARMFRCEVSAIWDDVVRCAETLQQNGLVELA
jgi:hypothetical protein